MIRTVVTMGYGNGTFAGTIALVVTLGYGIGEAVTEPGSYGVRLPQRTTCVSLPARTTAATLPERTTGVSLP
jgi:hypothetical protein